MSTDPNTAPNTASNVEGLGAPGPSGETGVENAPPFTDTSTTGADPTTGRRDVAPVDPAFGANEEADPAPDRSADDVADENARLRAELDEQNARLRAQVEESRAANVDAQGLTDEDVRRIEHPAEFVD